MSRIYRSLPPAGTRIGLAFSGGLDTRAAVAWMFTARPLQGEAAAHASTVNKALVAFLTCGIVAVAAISVGTNLARVSH